MKRLVAIFSIVVTLFVFNTLPVLSFDPQDDFMTAFTPQIDGIQTYIHWLNTYCKKDLYVADYTFTSPEVVAAYCDLASKGVEIHVILDKMESNAVKKEAPLIAQMRSAGIEIIITTSPRKKIMHNKFSVADGQWVIDGSFNYTDAANLQSNELNYNVVPSPNRAALFLVAWRDIKYYASISYRK